MIMRHIAFNIYPYYRSVDNQMPNNWENVKIAEKREKIMENVKKKDISPGNRPFSKILHGKFLLYA